MNIIEYPRIEKVRIKDRVESELGTVGWLTLRVIGGNGFLLGVEKFDANHVIYAKN